MCFTIKNDISMKGVIFIVTKIIENQLNKMQNLSVLKTVVSK